MAFGMGSCKCCGGCSPFIIESFALDNPGDLGGGWTIGAGEWSTAESSARTSTPGAFATYTQGPIASYLGFMFQCELGVYAAAGDIVHLYFFHRATTPEPKFTRVELDFGRGRVAVVKGDDGIETVLRVESAELTPETWLRVKLCRYFANAFHPNGLSIYIDDRLAFNIEVALWMGEYGPPPNYFGFGTGDVAEDVRFRALTVRYTSVIPDAECPHCAACLWPRLGSGEYRRHVSELRPYITVTADDPSFAFMLVANEHLGPTATRCGWRAVFDDGLFNNFVVYAWPVSETVIELRAERWGPNPFFGGQTAYGVYSLAFDMTQPDALAGDGPYTLPLTEVVQPGYAHLLPSAVIVEHTPA